MNGCDPWLCLDAAKQIETLGFNFKPSPLRPWHVSSSWNGRWRILRGAADTPGHWKPAPQSLCPLLSAAVAGVNVCCHQTDHSVFTEAFGLSCCVSANFRFTFSKRLARQTVRRGGVAWQDWRHPPALLSQQCIQILHRLLS
jgi:hypothetical protein